MLQWTLKHGLDYRSYLVQELDTWDGTFPLPFHISLREKHVYEHSTTLVIKWQLLHNIPAIIEQDKMELNIYGVYEACNTYRREYLVREIEMLDNYLNSISILHSEKAATTILDEGARLQ
ncbi:MAG: hypothetical protein E7309_14840 [Butyrivibrio sp.]|nr:hypothetical protein [Butyrivibrio sp.]